MFKYSYFIQFFIVICSKSIFLNENQYSNLTNIFYLNKTLLIENNFNNFNIFEKDCIKIKFLRNGNIKVNNSKKVTFSNKILIIATNIQNIFKIMNSSFTFKVLLFLTKFIHFIIK